MFVLVTILVVISRNGGSTRRRAGAAEPFPRTAAAAEPVALAAPEWKDVPLATSVVELGASLAQPVADGLAAARERVERCVVVEQRRDPAVVAVARAGAAPSELVLRLAPRAGAVHVVGVELLEAGGSPVRADCARRHLDGDAYPAPGAVPGRRYRLLVTIR